MRDGLDAVADSGDGGGRHKLTHLELVHPDNVDRFAEIGVIADPQVIVFLTLAKP